MGVKNPDEQVGGALEQQFALHKKAMQHTDRFTTSDSPALDSRFEEAARGAGIGNGGKTNE
jgi:hypothetical protein